MRARAIGSVFDLVGKRPLYDATGTQFMDFNTIFQLHAERAARKGGSHGR